MLFIVFSGAKIKPII